MNAPQTVTLKRQVDAIEIPEGSLLRLPEGAVVRILQSLGGAFTVATEHGYMARIHGRDADALGLEPQGGALPAEGKDRDSVEKNVWEVLRSCYDPEIPVNIVDLGLVYSCEIREIGPESYRVEVQMTLTAPGCGMGPILQADVEHGLKGVPGVTEANVEVVFEPMWTPERMSEAARLELGF